MRLCKHLWEVAAERHSDLFYRTALDARVLPIKAGHDYFVCRSMNAELVFVHKNPQREWFDVIARDQRTRLFLKFGFNARENRWASGLSPAGASIISKTICLRQQSDSRL